MILRLLASILVALSISSVSAEGRAANPIDSTFGTNGKVTIPSGLMGPESASLVQDKVGNLYLIGVVSLSHGAAISIWKVDSIGHLVNDFGSNGQVIVPVPGFDLVEARASAIDADDNIYITGLVFGPAPARTGVVKVDRNGKVVGSFGNDGWQLIAPDGVSYSDPQAIALDRTGNIYVVGWAYATNSTTSDIMVVKLTPSGTPVASFGPGGLKLIDTAVGLFDIGAAVATDSAGNVYVGAYAQRTFLHNNFVVAKLNGNGELVPGFADGGIARVTPTENTNDVLTSITLDSNGNIVLAGGSHVGSALQGIGVVVRLSPSGSLDTSFGHEGVALVNNGYDFGRVNAIALGSDGSTFLVGGTYTSGLSVDFTATKTTAGGSVDASFANAGTSLTDFGVNSFDVATSAVLDSRAEALYIAGYTQAVNGVTNYNYGIIKLLSAPAPPESSPGAKVLAIEYYHSEFDHYFITTIPDEIAKLDNGAFPGWARTGQSFGAFSDNPVGSVSVCRFFSTSFAPKSSHFYTPSAAECSIVEGNINWQFEGLAFNAPVPDSLGNCKGGSAPIYRMYNNGKGLAPNHRYSTSLVIRSQMIAEGWIPEGSGAAGVIMCSPI